jgi:hypothetical protein
LAADNADAEHRIPRELTGSWDFDIWGQIRRTVESDRGLLRNPAPPRSPRRVVGPGGLATDYFELRAQDQLQKLLDDTVVAEQLSLKITESRYKFGVAAKSRCRERGGAIAVEPGAAGQRENSARHTRTCHRRAGRPAAGILFHRRPSMRTMYPRCPREFPPPCSNVGRTWRKRSAKSPRRMRRSASPRPLTSRASPCPDRTIHQPRGRGYFQRAQSNLVGGSVARGNADRRRTAPPQVAQARAAYDASVDNYRQTVLSGFEQVEDQIATLRVLEQQAVIEDAAVAAAREAEKLTLNQYKAGTVPYSSVITAQTTRAQQRTNRAHRAVEPAAGQRGLDRSARRRLDTGSIAAVAARP